MLVFFLISIQVASPLNPWAALMSTESIVHFFVQSVSDFSSGLSASNGMEMFLPIGSHEIRDEKSNLLSL